MTRVTLAPEDVLTLISWTGNPRPLLPHLPSSGGGDTGSTSTSPFHVTINRYRKEIETHNLSLYLSIEVVHTLAHMAPPANGVRARQDQVQRRTTPLCEHMTLGARLTGANR